MESANLQMIRRPQNIGLSEYLRFKEKPISGVKEIRDLILNNFKYRSGLTNQGIYDLTMNQTLISMVDRASRNLSILNLNSDV